MSFISLFNYHKAELDAVRDYAGTDRANEPVDFQELVIRAGCLAYDEEFASLKSKPVKTTLLLERRANTDINRRSPDASEGLIVYFSEDAPMDRTDLIEPTGATMLAGGQTRGQRLARLLETCSVIPYKVWMDMPLADAFAASEALEPFFDID